MKEEYLHIKDKLDKEKETEGIVKKNNYVQKKGDCEMKDMETQTGQEDPCICKSQCEI